MIRKLTIELPEETFIAAMAVSEIKGITLDQYLEQRICDDQLVRLPKRM